MPNVSAHCTYAESIRSDIAKRYGILNYFTPAQLVNMKVSTVDYEAATKGVINAYKYRNNKYIKDLQKRSLAKYNDKAKKEWSHFLNVLKYA
jgi:hypothetical protein